MKQYRVCEDLQGGSFGMGRVYNIHEWIEQAQEWCEMDENPELAQWFGNLEEMLANGKLTEEEVLGEIATTWTIEFEEITPEQRNLYQQYVANYDSACGTPVCFAEWLDNEWEEIVFDRKMKGEK